MLQYLKISALALAALFAITQPLQAQGVVRVVPRVIVRPYYAGPYSRFGYWYGPSWYYPWAGPAYVAPRYYQPAGEVKIVTQLKDSLVYVDGGYAGLAGKLKHFDLSTGNHNIELRDAGGRTIFQERVQVIGGKTVEIRVNP